MNVLFVDDEPRVLEAIERTLFQLDLDWKTTFVSSGQEALSELARTRYDVLVSDMRMPSMDGAALLGQVCKDYPNVVRIVLSGQTDEESALRVVRVAHQFLAKPCSSDVLRRVIEQTSELKRLLEEPKLQAVAGAVERLPSAPRLFIELTRLLESDEADVESVTRVIRQDPAMASKLLQVANSAFFVARSTVSDLKVAVMRLGLSTIRNLALAVGAFDAASHQLRGEEIAWVDELQRRSLAVAKLAKRILANSEQADEAFLAGLMSNVGQLVLATTAKEQWRKVRTDAARRKVPAEVAEATTWGVTHAEIGGFLLGLWGLPFRVVEGVANHHAPRRNAHARLGVPQAVWAATALLENSALDEEYLALIGQQESLPQWQRWAQEGAQ